MLRLIFKNSFKRDVKLLEKRKYDMSLLNAAIRLLATGNPLPAQYCEHTLSGRFANAYECHITADWIMVYLRDKERVTLTFTRTGTHSDLFK